LGRAVAKPNFVSVHFNYTISIIIGLALIFVGCEKYSVIELIRDIETVDIYI